MKGHAGLFINVLTVKNIYGYKIAKHLIGLDIRTQGEEWDSYYDFLSMGDLEYHNLIEIDYKQVVIDGLYLAYQANVLEEQADNIESLSLWIAYLGSLSSITARSC